jgi:hypothetical protein
MYIHPQKKPQIFAKEPYISAKELRITTKEPCISAKETFTRTRRTRALLHIRNIQNSPMYMEKSLLYRQKSSSVTMLRQKCLGERGPIYISVLCTFTNIPEVRRDFAVASSPSCARRMRAANARPQSTCTGVRASEIL